MNKDLEKVYDEEIAPLILTISKICEKNQIPMVSVFQYKKTNICASIVAPDAFENLIIDDQGLFRYQTVKFISDLVKAYQKQRDL